MGGEDEAADLYDERENNNFLVERASTCTTLIAQCQQKCNVICVGCSSKMEHSQAPPFPNALVIIKMDNQAKLANLEMENANLRKQLYELESKHARLEGAKEERSKLLANILVDKVQLEKTLEVNRQQVGKLEAGFKICQEDQNKAETIKSNYEERLKKQLQTLAERGAELSALRANITAMEEANTLRTNLNDQLIKLKTKLETELNEQISDKQKTIDNLMAKIKSREEGVKENVPIKGVEQGVKSPDPPMSSPLADITTTPTAVLPSPVKSSQSRHEMAFTDDVKVFNAPDPTNHGPVDRTPGTRYTIRPRNSFNNNKISLSENKPKPEDDVFELSDDDESLDTRLFNFALR